MKKFIPELHDIGKLVDKNKIVEIILSDHTFVNLRDSDFKKLGIKRPDSPSWWGQYHHYKICNKDIDYIDLNNWNFIPEEYRKNLFLLKIADHIASSVSRVGVEAIYRGKPKNLIKLWNRKFYEKQEKLGNYWAAFKSVDDLKELFEDIQNCSSGEEFLEKYKNHLLLTPENKAFPWNLTTLYTHCKLVGKIYRILENCVKEIKENEKLFLEYFNEKVTKVKEAEGGRRTRKTKNLEEYKQGMWKFKLIKCKINFPHYFIRLQDLNILRKREELMEDFIKKYPDITLFHTYNFLLLFLPLSCDMNEIKKMFKDFLKWNFIIECVEIEADLGILRSNLDRKKIKAKQSGDKQVLEVLEKLNRAKVKFYYIQPEILDKIDLPICDICQLNKGVEWWKENIREWVCDTCQAIRNMGDPFSEYAEWDKENIKVIWFKISLNLERLENYLRMAFKEYIKSDNKEYNKLLNRLNRINMTFDEFIDEFQSLALITDFIEDYRLMLREFYNNLKEMNLLSLNKLPIKNYYELNVTKLDYSEKAIKIIEIFVDVFNKFFPDIRKDDSSPIKISLFIGSTKYPLRDIWRFFEKESENFINIRIQNIGLANYSYYEFKKILKLKKITSAYFDAIKVFKKTGSGMLYKLHLRKVISNEEFRIISEVDYRKTYLLMRLIGSV